MWRIRNELRNIRNGRNSFEKIAKNFRVAFKKIAKINIFWVWATTIRIEDKAIRNLRSIIQKHKQNNAGILLEFKIWMWWNEWKNGNNLIKSSKFFSKEYFLVKFYLPCISKFNCKLHHTTNQSHSHKICSTQQWFCAFQ